MSLDSDVYASALIQFLQAGINMNAATINIVAVTSAYVFDDTHDFLNDVPGGQRLGTALTLTGKTFGVVGKGKFNANPGTYTGVAAASVVDAFIGYRSTGVEATSDLIWYCNHRSDAVEISYTADGAGISVAWPLGFIFSI